MKPKSVIELLSAFTVLLLTAASVYQMPIAQAQDGSPGLVAAYAFDEGSGSSALNSLGSTLTGTVSGAAWTTQGRFGSALSFDGVNDWVTVADAAVLDVTTGMTVEAWVFPTATTGVRDILIKEGTGIDIYNLYARNGQGQPEANVFSGGTNRWATGSALPLSTWSHVAGTYDGATLRLFVNGIQAGSLALTGPIATSNGVLRIGGNGMWGEFFQGRIDEVRIYNRALSAGELQTDMNTPVGAPVADTTPPVRSNLQPTGVLAAGTTQATLSVTTDEAATCRYSVSAGVAYSGMPSTFTTTGGVSHTSLVTGLVNGGNYTYYVRCQDVAGNANTNDAVIGFSVSLTVQDTTPPTVAITAPLDGATVAGVLNVTAVASDNVGVAGVQFLLDGAALGVEDTSAPFTMSWDTTATPSGAHELRARARDLAGNTGLSPVIGLAVANNSVPANFQDEVVVGAGVTFPTALEFLPGGRMLIAEFTGRVIVVQPGASTPDPTPVLQLTNFFGEDVTVGGERGLVNVIADPSFATNGFIYLFYTAASPQRDRVSRFTMVGNVASLATELVVWQAVANSTSTDHHGGGLAFGPDGKLYISTGDNGDPPTVQSLTGDHGKILRVNKDGTVPTDNPFFDGAGGNIDAIWARGLRNPYRFSFDFQTGLMYVGDVGQNTTEELNLGVAGANYGWPTCEGPCGNAGMTNPIYSYPHSGRDAAITGGFVYRGTQFPAPYQGAYFYGDFAQNWIRYRTLNASGTAVTGGGNFLPADGALDGPYDPVMLKPGPDGSLYYVDMGWGWQSTANPASIRRIRYVVGNQPPIAVASASPLTGAPPLSVTFSSAGSIDPENEPLSYSWTFGDGTTSTEANPTHLYTQSGVYIAQLAVSDETTSSSANPLVISVGTLPVGTITAPLNGSTFRAGDLITFAGTAADAEDGTLPPASMTWTVLFRHSTHAHPAVGPLPGTATGSFAIQTSGHDFSGNTSYEIILTVTDSNGLQGSSSVTIFPEKVNLTFATNPVGLGITIDGVNHPTPYVHDTLIGFQHTLGAPDQVSGASSYTFDSWSDGGTQSHSIVVPATAQNYTATYVAGGPPPPPPGLVAGYGFNEGSGSTAQDASGNNFAGAISGAAWTTQGKFGSALSFDGVNDWVTVADAAALDLTTGMTIEAWVLPTASSGVRDILIKEGTGVDIYNLYARNGQGQPEANVFVGGGNRTAVAPALALNIWTHVAGTFDGTTLRLYINGVQGGSVPISGSIAASNGVLRIGGNSLWGEFFQGRIDEIRVYNRALGVAEIQADMITPVGELPGDTSAPVLSNLQPAGTLPAGTTQATLSLTTDEVAVCRYSETPGVGYSSMTATFGTTSATNHSTVVTGLVNGGSYTYYVRCQDESGNANPSDLAITFGVEAADATPPVLGNGNPAGTLPVGTTQTTLGLTTNEAATCRFGSTPGVPYSALPTTFSTTGGTIHTNLVAGLVNGGSYAFYARCQDVTGNTNPADFAIVFSVATPPPVDLVPPSVEVTAPIGGAVLAGAVTVSATASDNIGVVGVQFLMNGSPIGTEDTVAPYTTTWSSTSVANGGPYQLSARARDAAGNQTTATAVGVTVNNVSTGLVAAWGFNEGTGSSVQNATGSGLAGTVSGAAWTTQGMFGNALSFDGVNDWVTVADANALDLTTAMTLEAWVFPTAGGGGSWRNVLIKERANGEVYNLYSNTTSNVPSVYVVRAAQQGNPLAASGTTAVPLSTWTHLAATHNGTTLRLYVNGVQVGTRAVSGAMLTSTGALRIGGNSLWGEFFQGRIDEVRIYNRALTAVEIQADMNTAIQP